MDFMTPGEIEDERVLEEKVVSDIKNFIMKMGQGFSFIANQYRLELDGEEFFIDLLFFNRHLRCLVAFELKRGKFKPEYAGQLNFYLNVLDEKVKLTEENPSIGIILCKEKSNTIVEFAVKTIDKAMGVATYRTSQEVPKEMKGILPEPAELVKLLWVIVLVPPLQPAAPVISTPPSPSATPAVSTDSHAPAYLHHSYPQIKDDARWLSCPRPLCFAR